MHVIQERLLKPSIFCSPAERKSSLNSKTQNRVSLEKVFMLSWAMLDVYYGVYVGMRLSEWVGNALVGRVERVT